jgi:hypothetical protein
MDGSTHEAVGIFHEHRALQSAVDELLSAGFDRADLSILASRQAVKEKLGHAYRSVSELEDNPDVPTVAFVSTESRGDAEGGLAGVLIYVGAVATAGAVIASGGTIAAAIAAAILAGSGGAALGTLLASFVEDRHLRYLEDQFIRGGLLLWVRTRDAEHEKRAVDILKRNRAEHVHVHDLSAAAETAKGMRKRMSELVDEAGKESFPASDAPAFTSTGVGSPRR